MSAVKVPGVHTLGPVSMRRRRLPLHLGRVKITPAALTAGGRYDHSEPVALCGEAVRKEWLLRNDHGAQFFEAGVAKRCPACSAWYEAREDVQLDVKIERAKTEGERRAGGRPKMEAAEAAGFVYLGGDRWIHYEMIGVLSLGNVGRKGKDGKRLDAPGTWIETRTGSKIPSERLPRTILERVARARGAGR